jgi:hypothetical protein
MADEKTTEPKKDNNKRLAFLESRVSALAVAIAGLGVTVEEGADPIDLVIGLATGQAVQIDELEKNGNTAALAAIARAEKAEGELGELRGKVETVANYLLEKHPSAIVDINECCLVVAVKVMDDQAAEIAELETDIEQLEGKIEAINGGEGDELPAIAARERPENARDFGPTFGQIDAPEIGQLREEKAGLEIGFSNGEHEIVELAPVPINAADLQAVEGRYIAPTIHVKGGTHREDLHGAALLKDGEQIAYCQFPAPIALEVGQERRFDRAITFG